MGCLIHVSVAKRAWVHLHPCTQHSDVVCQWPHTQKLWTSTPGRSYSIPHPSKQGLVLSLGAGSPLGNDITSVAAAFAAKAGFALDARAFPAVVAGSSLQAQPALPLNAPGAVNNTLDSRWPDGWVSGFGLISAAASAGAMLNLAPLAQIPASLVGPQSLSAQGPARAGEAHMSSQQ